MGDCGTEPYTDESQRNASDDVRNADPQDAALYGLERLVFKGGKCRVASEKARNQQKTPVRMRQTLGQQRHQYSDQKRTSNINDQGSKRKPPANSFGNCTAKNITRQGSYAAAKQHQQISIQRKRLRIVVRMTARTGRTPTASTVGVIGCVGQH